MDSEVLFTAALKLQKPWRVVGTSFQPEDNSLHLIVDFERGSRFACPECGVECPTHDTVEKVWRHLDFFEYQAYLHARIPRIECKAHKTLQVIPPFARPGSGFTLLFEGFMLRLAKDMAVASISEHFKEHDTRIWRIIHRYVEIARKNMDMNKVSSIGCDETATRRGHDYITVFADMDQRKVLYATPGKGAETVEAFSQDFIEHGGKTRNVWSASIDMSPAFISGIGEHFPKAKITFDKFHVTKLVTEAVQATRREEQRQSPKHYKILKGSHFSLLKNDSNRNGKDNKRIKRITLSKLNLKTAKAWRMKETFRNVYALKGLHGVKALTKWCTWAVRCKIPAMEQAAKTIRRHWDGVIQYFHSGVTNAILESINSRIQVARARARGYRNKDYMISMLYLIAGKLDLIPATHSK
jgi:transposase